MPSLLALQPPGLLQSVLDNVGVALAVIDRERRFVFTNQTAVNMLGVMDNLAVAELSRQGYKLYDSQGREIPGEQAPIFRALEGEQVEPHEVRVTFPDGRSKWLHVGAHSFSVVGLTGVFVVVTDETEQVNLRKALERFQRIEEFAVLAGGLAHDLNNILDVVSGNTALALTDDRIEDIRTRLHQINLAVEKGSVLVGRLMRYSRKKLPEIRSVQINDVVNAALDLVRPLLRSVRVKAEISPGLPAVAADASSLEQVLINLILNALDAMPDGGELTLGTKLAPSDAVSGEESAGGKQSILITVADTGVGIPENLRRSIFDAFFTTKPDGEGAGLGLASARAVIRQHNGHIRVDSEVGAGTKFSIYLPADSQDRKEAA